MKKTTKSKGYEATPASLEIPLIMEPRVTPDGKGLHCTSASSLPFTVNDAIAETQETLSACRHAISENNYGKFRIMIREQPLLLENDWVREQLYRYRNRTSATRGRPTGSYSKHPNFILGFVNLALSTGQARNREHAYQITSDLLGVDYAMVKRHFHIALKLNSNKTMFFETGPTRHVN